MAMSSRMRLEWLFPSDKSMDSAVITSPSSRAMEPTLVDVSQPELLDVVPSLVNHS